MSLDRVRAALQAVLDEEGSGWQLAGPLAVIVGLERMNADVVEATAWMFVPDEQAQWITSGLLVAATEQRHYIDES